jgi:hypothetical protein
MSLFPTGAVANGQRVAIAGRDRLEADGVLARPISGQIYLIEEGELEACPADGTRSPLSGLISRH